MLLSFLSLLALTQGVATAVQTPVLTRVVERGEVLSSDDFTTEEKNAAQARGAIAPQEADGMEATRRLSAGAAVRESDIMAPRLVRRGEPVTIYVRSSGLTITAMGRALGNGAAGDRVRVVADATSRTLDGVVEGSGAVRVAAP
jgi:flagella basal body P-ring formation protein FlgA